MSLEFFYILPPYAIAYEQIDKGYQFRLHLIFGHSHLLFAQTDPFFFSLRNQVREGIVYTKLSHMGTGISLASPVLCRRRRRFRFMAHRLSAIVAVILLRMLAVWCFGLFKPAIAISSSVQPHYLIHSTQLTMSLLHDHNQTFYFQSSPRIEE